MCVVRQSWVPLIAWLCLVVTACSAEPTLPSASLPSAAATTLPTVLRSPTPTAGLTGSPTSAPTPPASAAPAASPTERTPDVPFELTSSVFADGSPIPAEYTCDGADLQLPVAWAGTPLGTVELALVMDDPDAGGFVHWVVVGIPASVFELAEPLPEEARHGRNGFGRARYNGPCPPSGTHTYVTTLYALSAPLEVGDQPGAGAVRRAAADVTLATAVLTGTYVRSR